MFLVNDIVFQAGVTSLLHAVRTVLLWERREAGFISLSYKENREGGGSGFLHYTLGG